MPINEARGARSTRALLNQEQRRQAGAEFLGVAEESTMPEPYAGQLSPEEVERMRALIAQHDARNAQNKVFDLNNPPKKQYVYQEFPRLMYRADGGTRTVHNAEQLAKAESEGFSKSPTPAAAPAEGKSPDAGKKTAKQAK